MWALCSDAGGGGGGARVSTTAVPPHTHGLGRSAICLKRLSPSLLCFVPQARELVGVLEIPAHRRNACVFCFLIQEIVAYRQTACQRRIPNTEARHGISHRRPLAGMLEEFGCVSITETLAVDSTFRNAWSFYRALRPQSSSIDGVNHWFCEGNPSHTPPTPR